MKARPILFSAPMVRALLAGQKTQTRRIVTPQPPDNVRDAGVIWSANVASNGLWSWLDSIDIMDAGGVGETFRCPYGVPGDLLWVRETHFIDGPHRSVIYKADDVDGPNGGWAPSIFLPRWASRLTLRLTDVRVQKLNEIDGLDAMAEGLLDLGINGQRWHWDRDAKVGHFAPWRAYRALWESLNGAGSWNADPWVWALTFEVVHQNIDAVLTPDVTVTVTSPTTPARL